MLDVRHNSHLHYSKVWYSVPVFRWSLTIESVVPYLFSYKIGYSPFLELIQIPKSVLSNFAIRLALPFLKNPKDLDLSYKT